MKNNKGFTVVELLVSVALLAIILVPVSQFFINSFKVQSRTQLKSSVTRVGQYVVENFKNKNYLGFDFSDIKVRYDLDNKPLNEFESIADVYEREIVYGGLTYNVTVDFDDDPVVSDNGDIDLPDTFGGTVTILEDGSISKSAELDYEINIKNKDEDFINRGKNYTAKAPTIILSNQTDEDAYSLLINNRYIDKLNVGIVKNFNNDLKIYVKGGRVYFEDGAPGDGRTAKMAKFESAYISSIDEETNKNVGELLLHANITVTDTRDTTVNDVFFVTFSMDYDYSEGGEE